METDPGNGDGRRPVGIVGRITIAERLRLATTPGARLRFARGFAGLTLGQAARLFDIPVPRLSDFETDSAAPGGDALDAIADTYGVGLAWLRDGVLPEVELPRGAHMLTDEEREDLVAALAAINGWRSDV